MRNSKIVGELGLRRKLRKRRTLPAKLLTVVRVLVETFLALKYRIKYTQWTLPLFFSLEYCCPLFWKVEILEMADPLTVTGTVIAVATVSIQSIKSVSMKLLSLPASLETIQPSFLRKRPAWP